MQISIIGGGKVVYYLAKKFISKGENVVIINQDKETAQYLSRNLKAKVIHGKASEPSILEEAETFKSDIVLGLTQKDYENLFICQMSRKYFGVKKTAAIINNPDNEQLFSDLGLNAVFNITHLLSSLIERNIIIEDIQSLVTLEDANLNITQVIISEEEEETVGKEIQELDFPENSMIGPIIRNDRIILPRGNTKLKAEDKVMVLTLPEEQVEAIQVLGGEI